MFRSRWKALWWAAGVCLTAYCSVPSPDHHTAAKPQVASADTLQQDDDSAQDEAALNSAMNGAGWGSDDSAAPQHQGKHYNPWAITPKH